MFSEFRLLSIQDFLRILGTFPLLQKHISSTADARSTATRRKSTDVGSSPKAGGPRTIMQTLADRSAVNSALASSGNPTHGSPEPQSRDLPHQRRRMSSISAMSPSKNGKHIVGGKKNQESAWMQEMEHKLELLSITMEKMVTNMDRQASNSTPTTEDRGLVEGTPPTSNSSLAGTPKGGYRSDSWTSDTETKMQEMKNALDKVCKVLGVNGDKDSSGASGHQAVESLIGQPMFASPSVEVQASVRSGQEEEKAVVEDLENNPVIQLMVPRDKGAGESFHFNHEGTDVDILVPEGASPGDLLKVEVPSARLSPEIPELGQEGTIGDGDGAGPSPQRRNVKPIRVWRTSGDRNG